MPPAPGDFILELVKALAGNNHNFRHDFIAQLGVIFEELRKTALLYPNDFRASRSALR